MEHCHQYAFNVAYARDIQPELCLFLGLLARGFLFLELIYRHVALKWKTSIGFSHFEVPDD